MKTILDYFDAVRPKKSHRGRPEWEARCPCKDSRERKVVITEFDDQFRLLCRRGCSEDEILASVGQDWRVKKKGGYVSPRGPRFDTLNYHIKAVGDGMISRGERFSDKDRKAYEKAVIEIAKHEAAA